MSLPFLKKIFSSPHFVLLSMTTLLALMYFSWDINSWKFSFVGDEWPFYALAREIVIHHFRVNPFDFNGVYKQNSMLSSMYQALFLRLFGDSNFVWRFSNIILIIPITIFFYQWMKKNFDSSIALYSTLLLQCSYYLANFFKIGKNMPQALTLMVACLFMATICGKNPTRNNFFILGLLLGLSFYIYIGPIFPLLIWPYLLPVFVKQNRHQKIKLLKNSLFLILGYFLLLAPLLFKLSELSGPAEKTFLSKEYVGSAQMFLNIFHNFFLFYASFDYLYNHFVAGPYLDLATQVLALTGTIIAMYHLRKNRYLFLLLAYTSTCIIIGITSPYVYAPTTRGIFYLPYAAAFAGIGLSYFAKKVHKIFVGLLILFIFLSNFYRSQIWIFSVSGYSNTALVVKTLMRINSEEKKQKVIIVHSDKYFYNTQNLLRIRHAYRLEAVPLLLMPIKLATCENLTNAHVIVIAKDKKAVDALRKLNCPREENSSIEIIKGEIPL